MKKVRKFMTVILAAALMMQTTFASAVSTSQLTSESNNNSSSLSEVVDEPISTETDEVSEETEESGVEETEHIEDTQNEIRDDEILSSVDEEEENDTSNATVVARYSDDGSSWTNASTLNEAFSANSGVTREIEVLSDITQSEKINIAYGTYVLYAKGDKKITRSIEGNLITVESGANLTIGNVDASGTLTIDGDKDNYSSNNGSLVYNEGTFTLTDKAVLINNTTTGDGGCVRNTGIFIMSGGEISGNEATYGGGVYNYEGTFTINGGMISSNTARQGGGAYNDEGIFTISGGTISVNTAYSGGGVFNAYRHLFTMSGGTISGNTATYGGGVYNYEGTFTMSGGTISGNTATGSGGGVYNYGSSATFTMSGTAQIPPGDNGKNDIYLYSGKYITVNGNLTGDNQNFLVTLAAKDAGTVIAKVDGTTKTAFEDSEFNKFNVNAVGKSIGLNEDKTQIYIKGSVRYRDGADSTWTAWMEKDTLNGAFGASLASGKTRQIEVLSDIAQSELIEISSGTYVLYAETDKTVTRGVEGDLITVGNVANLTIGKVDAGGTLTIDGDKDNYSSNDGSLVYNNWGTFTLTDNAVLTNNTTTGNGGGVFNSVGTFTMSGGTISGNEASQNGGGVYNSYRRLFTMSGGTISGNKATDSGGGVYNNGTFTMSGGTIGANTAATNGGGVYNGGIFTMSGTVQIPPENDNKNDIYLSSDNYIIVNGNLTSDSQNFLVMPQTTDIGTAIAQVDGTTKTAFEDSELSKFSLNVVGKAVGFNEDKTQIQIKGPVRYSDDDISTWTSAATLNDAFGAVLESGKTRKIEVLSDISQSELIEISSGTYVLYANSNNVVTRGVKGNLFKVGSGANFTIGNADAGGLITIDGDKDNYSSNYGSLVYNNGGTFTLTDKAVLKDNNNIGYSGGGVYNKGGTFTMSGGTISGNKASYGGGVYNNGTFTMESGMISGNTSTDYGGGVYTGSGVWNISTFTMSGGTIGGNIATSGGGVYNNGSPANFTMSGGTIGGNIATSGGGVYNNGTFTMEIGTISGNEASKRGGGVFNARAFTMEIGTISGNEASKNGGGVYNGGTFTMSGTVKIPPGNDNKNDIYLYDSNKHITVNGNLTGDSQNFLVTPAATSAGTVIAQVDGTTKTVFEDSELSKFSLNVTSKAVGFSEDKTQIQIKEPVRYSDDDGSTWTSAATLNDAFGAVLESGKTRKIEVLSDISQSELIEISSGTYVLYANSNKVVTRGVKGNLFKVGSGAKLTIGNADAGGVLTIDGNKDNYSSNYGSLVYNNWGTFTLTDKAVIKNNNNNNIGYSGGGVYNKGGTFTMSGGTISGNKASYGGGVYNYYGTFTMESGMISGNTSTDYGGGVCNYDGTFTMESGTISGNEATESGGGVYNGGTFTMSGTAQIPPGDENKNDIYLYSGKYITVNRDLTEDAQNFLVTPKTTDAGTVIVQVDGTTKMAFEDSEFNKFSVNAAGKSIGLNEDKTQIYIKGPVRYRDGADSTWTAWAEKDTLKQAFDASLESGKTRQIEVLSDIIQSEEISISSGTYVLYAKSNKVVTRGVKGDLFTVESGAKLTIGNADAGGVLTIDGNKDNYSSNYGSLVRTNCGTFTLTDKAALRNNITSTYGGGVWNWYGTFIMSGGIISGNIATSGGGVCKDSGHANFIMSGGIISDNIATQNGGGVYNVYGTVTMSGGTISGNTATNGGGVCNGGRYANFTMSGGTISDNIAAQNGGGVYNAYGTFTIESGTIGGNTATNGGGVYNDGRYAKFTMSGGTIGANTAAQNGDGVYNSIGTFNLSGTAQIPQGDNGRNDIYLSSDNYITVNGNLTGYNQSFLVTSEITSAGTVIAKVDGTTKTAFEDGELSKFSVNVAGKKVGFNEDKTQIQIKD